MTEEWREVLGSGGWYEVSNRGRVRCWKSLGVNPRRLTDPRVHRLGRDVNGYPRVDIRYPSPVGLKQRKVHQLVLEAFVGARPSGMVVRHLDGDPANNHLSNLAYGTYAENSQDQKRHGTLLAGSLSPRAKLSDDDRRQIVESSLPSRAIAPLFGITHGHVRRLRREARTGGGRVAEPHARQA